jgi:hypothetical protein
MPAATTGIKRTQKIVVLMVMPGAGSAEGRMERQASSSGRLDMRNLGMHKMTGWVRFYNLRIAVEHHRNPPYPNPINSNANWFFTT